MYVELLDTILNSESKDRSFYRYSSSISTLENWMEKPQFANLDLIIMHIEISRENLINKIVEENPKELIDYGSNNEIADIIFDSLTKDNMLKFKNLVYDNTTSFILFFSKTNYHINRKKYTKIEINWDLLSKFIDLDDLEELIKNEYKKELTEKDLQVLNFALNYIEKK